MPSVLAQAAQESELAAVVRVLATDPADRLAAAQALNAACPFGTPAWDEACWQATEANGDAIAAQANFWSGVNGAVQSTRFHHAHPH